MRRPRNLVKRGGWYYCRVFLGGKLYRRALGTREMETARDRLAATLDAIELEIRQAGMPKPVTVSEFAVRWMNEWVKQRRNPKGVKLTEQRWMQHIEPAIGSRELAGLTYADLRVLRGGLVGRRRRTPLAEGEALKPQTIHHILSDVRCLLRYAVDAGEIVKAPWRRDLMPRIAEHAPRRLTDAQLDRILLFARPKEALCIRLAVHTGLRWGELRTLQWGHVAEEPRPHLVLEGTKSGRVRRVPLSLGALEAIEGLRKISDSVFVSPFRAVNSCNLAYRNRGRMPVDHRVVWHWHQLRHTFACRYLEHGGSLAALQRMLGHSTSRMTERYAGLSDAALFADLDRVEKRRAADVGPKRKATRAKNRRGERAQVKVANSHQEHQETGPNTGPIRILEIPSARGAQT